MVKMTGVLKTEMAALASLWSCTRSHLGEGGAGEAGSDGRAPWENVFLGRGP